MAKRVPLLRAVLSFNMDILKNIQPYHKDFIPVTKIVTKLSKRVKKAGRKKVVFAQLVFVERYDVRFRKYRRKTIITETVSATSTKDARKVLRHKYGNKIKILNVKLKR